MRDPIHLNALYHGVFTRSRNGVGEAWFLPTYSVKSLCVLNTLLFDLDGFIVQVQRAFV